MEKSRDEIMHALRRCSKEFNEYSDCEGCPYLDENSDKGEWDYDFNCCRDSLHDDLVKYIQSLESRQKELEAKIQELEKGGSDGRIDG